MGKIALFVDKVRFKLGLDIRDPKAVLPDPKQRLEFLKSRTTDELKYLKVGEKHFSVAQELYDIADQYPDLTNAAVATLAKCMFNFDGHSVRWENGTTDFLVKLGPRATAAIPYLKTVLGLQMPVGYDPNEHMINVSIDQKMGYIIKKAQKDSRVVLAAILKQPTEEKSRVADNKVACSRCGKMILERMAVLKKGLCIACSQGRIFSNDAIALASGHRKPQAGDSPKERTRKKIWNAVGPASLCPPDNGFWDSMGPEAVPAIKEIFQNPSDQMGTVNEALLVVGLEQFANKDNEEAAMLLHELAEGRIAVAGAFAQQALNIAKKFAKEHLLESVNEKNQQVKPATQYTEDKFQLSHKTRSLLSEFNSLNQIRDIAGFLKRHSEEDLGAFIETFLFSDLKIDYASVEKDFQNCRRMELVLHLASILLRWKDYSSDPRWEGLLPQSLNALSLYTNLSSRFFPFIESLRETDIAMVLRTKLYDFAMNLIREDKNREAMLCLEISRPSPREDHDFWLCACYYNIGKLEKDMDIIARGVELAEKVMRSESKTPTAVLQKMRQSGLLGKLKNMESELADAQEQNKKTVAKMTSKSCKASKGVSDGQPALVYKEAGGTMVLVRESMLDTLSSFLASKGAPDLGSGRNVTMMAARFAEMSSEQGLLMYKEGNVSVKRLSTGIDAIANADASWDEPCYLVMFRICLCPKCGAGPDRYKLFKLGTREVHKCTSCQYKDY